jgi:hypothetical protein
MSASSQAKNAIVMTMYSHCRRLLGLTPRKYGPAIHTAARSTNHVMGDLMNQHAF